MLTNIFPTNIGAVDLESRSENLYFRIDEKPQIGFITHTRLAPHICSLKSSIFLSSYHDSDITSFQLFRISAKTLNPWNNNIIIFSDVNLS